MNTKYKMVNGVAKIFLVAVLFISISSCEKRNCQNVACPQGQGCNNGRCYCADGYEGNDCSAYSYLKYEANFRDWNVSESCYSSAPNFSGYTISIQHDPSDIRVVDI